jgi:hypothetical protein
MHIPTTSAYPNIKTNVAKFAGSHFQAQIVGGPTGNGGDQFGMTVQSPSSANCKFDLWSDAPGTLTASFKYSNGVPSTNAIGAYDPVAHKYLRIRHDVATATLYWETSPNGSTWTTVFSGLLSTTGWDITTLDTMFGQLWAGNATAGRPDMVVESVNL